MFPFFCRKSNPLNESKILDGFSAFPCGTLANPENEATKVTVIVSTERDKQEVVFALPDGLEAGSSVTKAIIHNPRSE